MPPNIQHSNVFCELFQAVTVLDQERLCRWVSFLALCGVLEQALQEQILGSYFLKGGVALELRFATRARATKDLDLGLEGPRGSRVDLFQRALGFDAFTFRLKAQTRDMEQADTVRVNVAVAYRTRAWKKIEIDLGPASGQLIDFIEPQVVGLAELGLPVTSPVRCLSMAEEVAQKLHACTSPNAAGRVRDTLAALLVDMLQGFDFVRAADAVQPVFAARATHTFPPKFKMRNEWRPEVEALAAQLGMTETRAAQIEERFRAVLQRIAEAMS
jgi:hypothetical protein